MPRVPSENDRAAKAKTIASHRWFGANTAVPLYYDAPAQWRGTEAFLESGVVSAQLFAVENERTRERSLLRDGRPARELHFAPGDLLTVDALISVTGIGHSFPPELRDLYEAWVAFEARDGAGRVIASSGALDAKGELDPRAHVFRQVLVDREDQPLLHHEVWQAVAKDCDNRIAPGQPELLHFRFSAPRGDPRGLTLHLAVRYRRFNKQYSDYVLKRESRALAIPVVTMAEAEALLGEAAPPATADDDRRSARKWNEYGLALLGSSDRRAIDAFRAAAALDPSAINYRINEAVGELTAQRVHSPEEHAANALALLEPLAASSPRAAFWKIVALKNAGVSSAEPLRALASSYPRDRELWRRLGAASAADQSWGAAQEAFETVLSIDPLDAEALHFLNSVFRRLDQPERAQAMRDRYYYVSHFANAPLRGACDGNAKLIDAR